MNQRWTAFNRWDWIVLAAVFLNTAEPIAVAAARQQAANPNAVTLAEFKKRVDNYIALHKRVAEKTGPLEETHTPTQIAARESALGKAIQAARMGARQGDIFTPQAATLFRAIIREEFAHRSRLALEDRDEAQDELPDFTPKVNQIYPTTHPLATFPPGVLSHLPPLPEPLEYRFVQRYLILRDIEANLIIDVLPGAAPAMSSLTPRRGAGR